MGYVFTFKDAVAYDQWFRWPANRAVSDLEGRLISNLLEPIRGETVLDIGCGTGRSMRPLLDMGLHVSGLDPSPYMLDIARNKLGERVDLHRGFGEKLPFADNAFAYACLNTALEFVDDPCKTIAEACRVARHKLYLGVFNRHAIHCLKLRVKGLFTDTVFNHARFFSIWELKQIVHGITGAVPVQWRTLTQIPLPSNSITNRIEKSAFVQRSPFGAYAGMVISLVPRFRTRPLPLTYRPKQTTGIVPGLGSVGRRT